MADVRGLFQTESHVHVHDGPPHTSSQLQTNHGTWNLLPDSLLRGKTEGLSPVSKLPRHTHVEGKAEKRGCLGPMYYFICKDSTVSCSARRRVWKRRFSQDPNDPNSFLSLILAPSKLRVFLFFVFFLLGWIWFGFTLPYKKGDSAHSD